MKAMTKNSVVRVRINQHIKEEAEIVLSAMGLSISDALRLLLTKVAKEKGLPFAPLIPNKETIEAMRAILQGDVISTDREGLVDSLNNYARVAE